MSIHWRGSKSNHTMLVLAEGQVDMDLFTSMRRWSSWLAAALGPSCCALADAMAACVMGKDQVSGLIPVACTARSQWTLGPSQADTIDPSLRILHANSMSDLWRLSIPRAAHQLTGL